MAEYSITSKDVNHALRSKVWPRLQAVGFVERATRTAWRRHPDRVEVVNFQSFNAHLAQGIGATTFSFAVNLGILVPGTGFVSVPRKDGLPRPQVSHCDLRRGLEKRLAQPELERKGVWFVRADGANLAVVVDDACAVLGTEGLSWFERFSSLQRILAYVTDTPESAEAWGMGNAGSPNHKRLIARLSEALAGPN